MRIFDNDFKLKLKDGEIKEYEKIILTEVNDIFMPMGFVSYDEGELVIYNCSGYSSLGQCEITEVMEALEILERTFLQVSRAGEYLISANKITLSMDTIFYDKNTGKVKIAYVPVKHDNASLRENMAGFLSEMKGKMRENDRVYIENIKNQMEENNYYLQDLINVIGDIRRNAAKELLHDEVVQ